MKQTMPHSAEAKTLAERYAFAPAGAFHLRRDPYRVQPNADGTLLVAELGLQNTKFTDGGIRRYSRGRETGFMPAGYQVMGLTGLAQDSDQAADTPLFAIKGRTELLAGFPTSAAWLGETNCADVVGMDTLGSWIAWVDRAGKTVMLYDMQTTTRLEMSLADLPWLPMDVCITERGTILVALVQIPLPGHPVHPMSFCELDMEKGTQRIMDHLTPKDGDNSCMAICRGPKSTYFVVGSGHLWKMDQDFSPLFHVRLADVCHGKLSSQRPPYMQKRQTPFFFDVAFDGRDRLYVTERNLFGSIFIFKVC